jgi:hypothetical protein
MTPEQATAHIVDLIQRTDKAGYGLSHLGDMRELSHLSKDQFDRAVDHARRAGAVSLSNAEGRHGLSERDRASSIYEPDYTTMEEGKPMMQAKLYAHLRNS